MDRYILVIDDDEDDRYLMNISLMEHGYKENFKILPSGDDALKFLESLGPKELPSLIILDYNMPRMNGLEVLSRIKAKEKLKSVPVVLYSTGMTDRLMEIAGGLGAAKCFQKPYAPFEINAFMQDIDRIIRTGQPSFYNA